METQLPGPYQAGGWGVVAPLEIRQWLNGLISINSGTQEWQPKLIDKEAIRPIVG